MNVAIITDRLDKLRREQGRGAPQRPALRLPLPAPHPTTPRRSDAPSEPQRGVYIIGEDDEGGDDGFTIIDL